MKRRPRLRVVVSFRGIRSRLARSVGGSIAVHGALLAAVLVVPATRRQVTPIDDSMVVALAGPIASAPAPRAAAAAADEVKPAPAPPPPPKEAQAVREIPVPKPKDKDKPVKPVKPPPKEPDHAPEPQTPAAPKGGAHDTPSDAKPVPGGGAVTATVGGGDSSLGWYGAAVKAALEAAWAKPYLEDAQGTVSVVVAFDIARNGTTDNFRIVQSSGIPSLDRSAQRAVIEASPLPAVPPTWTEATLPVTMRFDLSPETR
jgi:TonB family protein